MDVLLIVLGVLFLIAGGFAFLGERKKKIKVWVILILVSILLIIAGTVLVLVKKDGQKTTAKTIEYRALKPSPVQPKEEVWIFVWMATDELMEKNPQQKPFSEYVTKNVICSEKELSFIRFEKGKYKDKIVLTRNESDEYYLGYVFNKIEKKYNPVRLFPEKGNFEGYIFTSKGSKIIATLKRQNHL